MENTFSYKYDYFKKIIILIGLIFTTFSCENDKETDPTPQVEEIEIDIDIVIDESSTKNISPFFFGQNYWSWVSEWGAQVKGTEPLMKNIGLNLLRLGGSEPDRNFPEAFNYEKIDEAVEYANQIGVGILLQIPLLNNYEAEAITVEEAMDIIRYIKKQEYPIEFIAIGNEPDLYVEQGLKSDYTPDNLIQQFNLFSDSIRAIDSNFKIIGPDLAWKYYPSNNWLKPFLSGSKDKLDIVSVHRYPFEPQATTVENAILDAEKFRNDIRMIKGYFSETGLTQDLPLAITETHITFNGDPQFAYMEASPASFWAAMWVADVIGVGLEEELWNLSFWSISEGWTLGFIDGETKEPRPSYHALKLMATHTGNQQLKVTHNLDQISVYASKNETNDEIYLTIINKNDTQQTLKWKFEGIESNQENEVNSFSINLMVIKNNIIEDHWEYTQEMALDQSEPTVR